MAIGRTNRTLNETVWATSSCFKCHTVASIGNLMKHMQLKWQRETVKKRYSESVEKRRRVAKQLHYFPYIILYIFYVRHLALVNPYNYTSIVKETQFNKNFNKNQTKCKFPQKIHNSLLFDYEPGTARVFCFS